MGAREGGPVDLLIGGTWRSGAVFAPDLAGTAAHDAWRIAQALRFRRKARRLTQAQVAELAGISVRSVRDIELGTVWPSLRTVSMIAAALETHIRLVRPRT